MSAERRALAVKMRRETNLTVRQIAFKVNANKTTVGIWLKGVRPGQDRTGQDGTPKIIVRPGIGTGQDRTGHGTRDKAPGAVLGVHTGQDRTGQGKHGQSKVVQDTFKKAAEIIQAKVKHVKAKKAKPKYERAIIEEVNLEVENENKDTIELEEKPKKKGNIYGWFILLVILGVITIPFIINWLRRRSNETPGDEETEETTINVNGFGNPFPGKEGI